MNTSCEVTVIAHEAVDQLECATKYMSWFESLSWSIKHSLDEGHVHHAKNLASAAQYLAVDYHSLLEKEAKDMNSELSALAPRV